MVGGATLSKNAGRDSFESAAAISAPGRNSCATLRSFGRILMAAISPERTREAQKLVPEFTLPVALSRMYGLTPLELSHELFSTSRLPKELLRTFRDCEPEALQGTSPTYDSHLLGITR